LSTDDRYDVTVEPAALGATGLGVERTSVVRWREGAFTSAAELVAVEEPLEIRLKAPGLVEESISLTMRTPGMDGALAVGFLFGEGILRDRSDLEAVTAGHPGSNLVTISLTESAGQGFDRLRRNFAQTSSCGVCGKRSIDDLRLSVEALSSDGPFIDPRWLVGLPDEMRGFQQNFDVTGGLHAVGLFELHGPLIACAEDVGRHNALDKIVGASFLAQMLPWSGHVLVLSGRASFELIQKAAAAGVRCVVAVGAPSSLAVSLAERAGITLAGFVRRGGFNVYTHPERLRGVTES